MRGSYSPGMRPLVRVSEFSWSSAAKGGDGECLMVSEVMRRDIGMWRVRQGEREKEGWRTDLLVRVEHLISKCEIHR